MRLLTTCLRWELAQQPPVLLTDVKSITSFGPHLIITYHDGRTEKIVDDHEMTFRVLA
jgi:hypothetical protein